jgi:hypothetical protein
METLDLTTLALLDALEGELEQDCQEMLNAIDPDTVVERFWTVGRGWNG